MSDDSHVTDTEPNAAPPHSMTSSTLGRIAVRVTIWTGIGTYLNQLIGFVATLVMTRLLDPSVFGTFSLATFWFTLLNLRPKSGISYSAIRQPESNGTLLGTYWGLDALLAVGSLLLSIVTGFILLWLYANVPAFTYTPLIVVSIIVLMLADGISVIVSPLSLVLEKEMQLSRLTLVSLVAALVAYAAAIGLALMGAGIGALLAVNIVTALVSMAGVFVVCRRRWPQAFRWHWHFDRHFARRLTREGLPTGMSLTALGSIVTQFDNFLIGTFVGATTLGYYDRAYRIASWPNILLTMIVSRVGFLTFTKVRDDQARLTHAVRLSFWVLLTLGIPIALVLFFGAEDVVKILYTSKYSESAYFLRFLTLYSLVWPFVSLGFWLAVSLGHHRRTVGMTTVQAASLMLLGLPLTLQFGVNGTLVAVAATMVLAFSVSCRYIFRQVVLSVWNVFGAHVLALLAAVLILVALQQLLVWNSLHSIVRLMLIGILGNGTFLLTLFILRPQETRERVAYVRDRFLHESRQRNSE
ncbi:MAG TPA: oligosaccharide flippase family protein [Anaerolineae bacterium]|nr:oligosaccharide flippase family protein [Anaerolineae bacterium]